MHLSRQYHRCWWLADGGWLRVFTRHPCTTAAPLTHPPPPLANQSVFLSRQATQTFPSTTPAAPSSAGLQIEQSIDCNPPPLPCSLPADMACVLLHKQSMAPGSSDTLSRKCVVRAGPICRSVSPPTPSPPARPPVRCAINKGRPKAPLCFSSSASV